jgi:hypothetical protein
MDALYSNALLAALALSATGALAGFLVLRRPGIKLRRITVLCTILALVSGMVSFMVHLRYGHGPSTPEPMSLGRFVGVHPAYIVVVMLSILGFIATLLSRHRIS